MQQVRIDFDNPGLPQSLGVVEGESQSRLFQAALYKSGAAYTAPAGAVYSIMYRGFGPQNQGWYDTIEDGAGKRAACTVSGNVVTCELARQALRVPGHLTVVLCVSDAKGYMLKSWPIMADARNDGYEDTVEVESFFYITQITSAEWTKAFAAWEDFKATIDPTLSVEGKAADAKATGDAVGALKEDLGDSNRHIVRGISNANFGNYSQDYAISGAKGSSFAAGAVKLSAGTIKELRIFIYGNDSNDWILLGKTFALGEMLVRQAQEDFTKVRFFVIINEKSLLSECSVVFNPQNDSIKSSLYFLQSKVFHQNVITVGGNGCDYHSINEAVYNARDSEEFPVTILIYPGIYNEVVISLNRYLSFIGINRETCIIRDTSGKYANCPIKISGGKWTLENLTFIATAENAGSWVPTWENFDFPSYAIHVDGGGSGEGHIRNCTAYSECINAIGMGLHNNETVTIENCTIERNVKKNEYDSIYYQGALACHSTTNRTEPEKNEFLIVRNCEIISNTSKAVQLYTYTLGSPWKFAFEGCTFEANGKVDETVYFRRGTEALSLMARSHGNNAKELNS